MSSSTWLPESASECTPSATIDDEPVNAAATNFDTAMPRFAARAAMIARLPLSALTSRAPRGSCHALLQVGDVGRRGGVEPEPEGEVHRGEVGQGDQPRQP